MSVNSVDFNAFKYSCSVGPDGHLDPKKCKTKPNCIWTKPLTPEEKEKLVEFLKDPKNHFKPGIFDPEAQKKVEERKKTLLQIGGVALAAILAFVFRGNIKAGAQKLVKVAAPYVKKAADYLKNTKVYDAVSKGISAVAQKAKDIAPNIVSAVKTTASKVLEYGKNLISKIK